MFDGTVSTSSMESGASNAVCVQLRNKTKDDVKPFTVL